jgi:transcriptional regulator with XRE-family HTH domain
VTTADPDRVDTRSTFAHELTLAREQAGLTVRELARRVGLPTATVGGYLSGRHLPATSQTALFAALLAECRITGEQEVERWLAALTRVRSVSDGRAARVAAPYRGLEPFHPEDAPRFFGRDHAIALVLRRLRDQRAAGFPLLAVIGPSGSGKSSLLRAGVVPKLRAGALDAEGTSWDSAVITPGSTPVASLNACLGGLDSSHRVVVVDQFEEVFTQCRDATVRAEFFDALRGFNARTTLAVLGLRANFYDVAAREPALVPVLQHAQVLVAPMAENELRSAIVNPTYGYGVAVLGGVIRAAEKDGWTIAKAHGHAFGWLLCGDGCRLVIYSTPRGAKARILHRAVRKCPHGHSGWPPSVS